MVVRLVDECAETVEKAKIAKITLAENENKHNVVLVRCTVCWW